MRILFVINNCYIQGNGLYASARRTVKALREAGEDVALLTSCDPDDPAQKPEFPLKKFHFPIFQPIIDSEGFCYADGDPKVIEEAIKWADVVHLEENFVLQYKAIKFAKKWKKPLTATYHIHPENILCPLGMGKWGWASSLLLNAWRKLIYDHCLIIQCPTQNVYDRLLRHHLKAELRTISNGLIPDACIRPETPPDNYLDPERPFEVLCIGRFAPEKDQVTLMEAMRYSRFAKRIHLSFAGNGPDEKRYKKKAKRLYDEGVVAYEPTFGFYDRQGLRELAANADLCIHCAIHEVEGLSIMEALQQAAVPIIAEGRFSGTPQFALDRRSVFPAQNPEALARRIDYWLSHPKERWEMGFRYALSMKQYDIAQSVEQLIAMFHDAINKYPHVEETS